MSWDQEATTFCREDVLMGPLTMDEIKYSLLGPRPTFRVNQDHDDKVDNNRSFRPIETHSTPNLLQGSSTQQQPLHQLISPDVSSEATGTFNCDITANEPDDSYQRLGIATTANNESLLPSIHHVKNAAPNSNDTVEDCVDKNSTNRTPLETSLKVQDKKSPREVFTTPLQKIHNKTPFKTPGNALSEKKLYVTPSNRFQHIKSPVAAYINESPVIPLVREMRPKKHLHGVSLIPRLIKRAPQRTESSKENVNQDNNKLPTTNYVKLPSIAYRPAKKMKVIHIPDKQKMPNSQWAKKVESSNPKALVIRHHHREINHVKEPQSKNQEDSFADLSLHQADLSVCTQKSAFNKH